MPADNPSNLAKHIALNCLAVRMRLLNRMVAAVFDEAIRPYGIRASQLNILVAVSAYGPGTSRQLCRVLHMDTSTFSRAMSRMKNKGWLQSTPSGDGKIQHIEATQQGLELLKKAYPAWERAQTKVAQILGDTATETIIAAGNKHLLEGMTG
jgi:DNA-binding MarR family transcriptional regulator